MATHTSAEFVSSKSSSLDEEEDDAKRPERVLLFETSRLFETTKRLNNAARACRRIVVVVVFWRLFFRACAYREDDVVDFGVTFFCVFFSLFFFDFEDLFFRRLNSILLWSKMNIKKVFTKRREEERFEKQQLPFLIPIR